MSVEIDPGPGLSVVAALQLQAFLLVFARITAMLYLFPIFGSNQVPAYFKAGLATAITLCVTIAHPPMGEVLPWWTFLFQVAVQAFLGLVIGYVAFVVFMAILLFGQIVDIEMGFALANVIDPVNNIQQSLIGQFQNLLAFMFFLSVDGHHRLILVMSQSFDLLPLGQAFHFTHNVGMLLIAIFGAIFTTALQLAFPMIGAMLLTDLVLGLLSRLIPQMNVFVVGFPIKLGLGLYMLTFLVTGFIYIYPDMFERSYAALLELTKQLGKP